MGVETLAARGRLGQAAKSKDPTRITSARRDLAAAKLEDYIERTLAGAPPLTDAQVSRIAAIIITPSGGAHV